MNSGVDDSREQHPGDSTQNHSVGSAAQLSEYMPDARIDDRSGSHADGSPEQQSDESSKGGRLLIGHSLGAACVAAQAIDQPQVPLSNSHRSPVGQPSALKSQGVDEFGDFVSRSKMSHSPIR